MRRAWRRWPRRSRRWPWERPRRAPTRRGRRSRPTTTRTSPSRRSGLIGTTAVVAWTQQTGPEHGRSRHGQLHDLADAGRDRRRQQARRPRRGRRSTTRTRSSRRPAGASQLASPASTRPCTGDPLIGLVTTLRNADGTWAAPFVVSGSSCGAVRRPCSRAPPRSSRGYAHAGHRALQRRRRARAGRVRSEPADPARRLLRLLAEDGARRRRPPLDRVVLQRDAARPACTCSSSTRRRARRSARPRWRRTARASTTTASARRSPAPRPAASSTATRRPAGPTDTLVSWWPGQARRRRSPTSRHRAGRRARRSTAAYRADGRLWVAWCDGKTYRATLGDATGAGGEVQDAGVPDGRRRTAPTRSRASAVGDNLLLAANYDWKRPATSCRSRSSSTRVAPAGARDEGARPARRDAAADAGRQGLPHPGAVHAAQGLHEPRRRARCAASCARARAAGCTPSTPLPGDSKLVLGTRGRFAAARAARARSASTSRSARRSC